MKPPAKAKPEKPEPRPATGPVVTAAAGLSAVRTAVIFLAVVVAGLLVRVFEEILSPLVVATFLMLLVDALARGVAHWFPKVPRWIRAGLAGGLILVSFAAVVLLFVAEAPPFAKQLAGIEPRLDDVLLRITMMLNQPPLTVQDVFAGSDPSRTLGQIFSTARTTVSYAVLVVIYFGFIVASRQAFSSKLDRLYDTDHHREQARRVFSSIRDAVERYVRLQTLKALMIAIVAWGAMFALGVKGALFVAFLVFLAAYVPIIGAFAGAVFPGLVALAQLGSLEAPVLLMAGLGVCVFLIDNVLMPKLQGDELNIDPLLVLISIGFWALILGAPGVLLSTPLTVTVMAVAAEFRGTRWLAVLISKDGEPFKGASEA